MLFFRLSLALSLSLSLSHTHTHIHTTHTHTHTTLSFFFIPFSHTYIQAHSFKIPSNLSLSLLLLHKISHTQQNILGLPCLKTKTLDLTFYHFFKTSAHSFFLARPMLLICLILTFTQQSLGTDIINLFYLYNASI